MNTTHITHKSFLNMHELTKSLCFAIYHMLHTCIKVLMLLCLVWLGSIWVRNKINGNERLVRWLANRILLQSMGALTSEHSLPTQSRLHFKRWEYGCLSLRTWWHQAMKYHVRGIFLLFLQHQCELLQNCFNDAKLNQDGNTPSLTNNQVLPLPLHMTTIPGQLSIINQAIQQLLQTKLAYLVSPKPMPTVPITSGIQHNTQLLISPLSWCSHNWA